MVVSLLRYLVEASRIFKELSWGGLAILLDLCCCVSCRRVPFCSLDLRMRNAGEVIITGITELLVYCISCRYGASNITTQILLFPSQTKKSDKDLPKLCKYVRKYLLARQSLEGT